MPNFQLNDKTEKTTPSSADFHLLYDVATSSLKKTKKSGGKIVEVWTEADFPTPVANVIYLEQKSYRIMQPFTLNSAYSFNLNGNYPLYIGNSGDAIVTWNGSGTLFTGTTLNSGIEIYRVSFVNNLSGTMFNINNANAYCILEKSQYYYFASLGTINGAKIATTKIGMVGCSQGFSFTGSTKTLQFSAVDIAENANAVGFKGASFSGTHNQIQINDGKYQTAGSNESLLNIDSGIVMKNLSLSGNNFDILTNGGSVFAVGSKTETDPYINASGNAGLAPSSTHIETARTGTPTAVTFTATNELVIPQIAGFTTAESERITADTNGVLTYTGLSSGRVLKSDSSIIMAPSSSTHTLGIKCFEISSTSKTCTFDAGTDVATSTAHGFVDGDAITFLDSSGTMPTGLLKNNIVYVINSAANTFKFSYTSGGSAIDITTNGSGTLIAKKCTLHGTDTLAIASTTPTAVPSSNLITVNTSSKIAFAVYNSTGSTTANITTQKFVLLPTK